MLRQGVTKLGEFVRRQARGVATTTMNLRQTQRALADLMAKCHEAHIQMPPDPFDSLLNATDALQHSRVGGNLNIDDALDEMKQRYGLEAKWQQQEPQLAAKQKSRPQRQGNRSKAASAKPGTRPIQRAESHSETESDSNPPNKRTRAKKSRVQSIIEHNPAKNPANEELAEEFVELGGYELKHGETQKGISRMAVAKQIRLAKVPIESGAAARKLPHVGRPAATKIDEVLHEGKMQTLASYGVAEGNPASKADTSNDAESAAQNGIRASSRHEAEENDRDEVNDEHEHADEGDDEAEEDDGGTGKEERGDDEWRDGIDD